MTALLAVIAILAITTPVVQGVLGAIEVGVVADESVAWRANGCPIHHLDGSLHYLCKRVVKK
jgi:hypothetical protein